MYLTRMKISRSSGTKRLGVLVQIRGGAVVVDWRAGGYG